MVDERQTQKYRLALALVLDLEARLRLGRVSVADIYNMECDTLYRWLEEEWWYEWNGLTQEWQEWQA